jgi:hypothetical protein
VQNNLIDRLRKLIQPHAAAELPFPLVPLLVPHETCVIPGTVQQIEAHEKVAEATTSSYETEYGTILVTVWNNCIHEVIYQMPLYSKAAVARRNAQLFCFYSDDKKWNKVLDNGFGITYRRADMERYALYSYAMDINTFGTMGFHEAEYGSRY